MATATATPAPATAAPTPGIAPAGDQSKRLAQVPVAPPAALEPAAAVTALAENSLVEEDSEIAGPMARLPVGLDVAVPVREFRVHNLLALGKGQLIESQWGNGDDLPLTSGEVQLAWCEFEVIDSQLAVRLTRMA